MMATGEYTNTNTKDFIANHSAQDEQNNHNKFSYNDIQLTHSMSAKWTCTRVGALTFGQNSPSRM